MKDIKKNPLASSIRWEKIAVQIGYQEFPQ